MLGYIRATYNYLEWWGMKINTHKNWKPIKKGVLIIFGVIICIYTFVVFQKEFHSLPQVDVINIDMRDTPLPIQWDCEWCKKKPNARWTYEETSNLTLQQDKLPIAFPIDPDFSTKAIIWLDENDGYLIEVIIIEYRNPLEAKFYYLFNDPKGIYQKHNWNFTYAKDKIVPPEWNWVNPQADDEAVRCGEGDHDNCLNWFYQARFGQYYLLINFNNNLNLQGFEKFVIAINDQFLKNIK
jgi:hypothetical protein